MMRRTCRTYLAKIFVYASVFFVSVTPCNGGEEGYGMGVVIASHGTNVTYTLLGKVRSSNELHQVAVRILSISHDTPISVCADVQTPLSELNKARDIMFAAGVSNVPCFAAMDTRGTLKRVFFRDWAKRDLEGELFEAINAINLERVEDLVNKGAYLEARNSRLETPLCAAVARSPINERRLAVIKLLISRGAEIEAKDVNGLAPLCAAVLARSLEAVNMLIAARAHVQTRDRQGFTPLIWAPDSSASSLSIVQALVDANADVNACSDGGMTALHRALIRNRRDVAEYLVGKGADVEAKMTAGNGDSPLHLAIGYPSVTMVKFLLAHKASVTSRNNRGMTPLHYAAGGDTDIIKVLMKAGSDINATDDEGRTPLHLAVNRGREVVSGAVDRDVGALIPYGPDLNKRDRSGARAIDIARKAGRESVVKLLKDAAATD